MSDRIRSTWFVGVAAGLALGAKAAVGDIAESGRGAVIETDRYRVGIVDGVVRSIHNRHTNEECLDPLADPAKVLPHLPSGLGTQHTEAQREAAARLYDWPWWEHDKASTWSNQHYPAADSQFTFHAKSETAATLTYRGLTDGQTAYADETYNLDLEIDEATGDLLLTPGVSSPRPGVYAANLTVAPLAPGITVEAPIFDGVRLDADMQPMLWATQWPSYWDYAFLALNGRHRGAVGLWAQDAECRTYKSLFYRIDEQGLALSLSAMNTPPFEKLTEAKPMTWRLQAFDQSWAQAAARFRAWRETAVEFGPRPDWAKQISFVGMGVNAHEQWLDNLKAYFENRNLDRTMVFAATIRGAAFDTNHANNTPYPTFKEDMAKWKASGSHLMAYLQPMIMWAANAANEREQQALALHKEADTRSVLQANHDTVRPYHDQHHLGHPGWQRWFLDWVKEYIQDYGASGVYHDQSYPCPIDVRGLAVNNMTSPQGMADYFRKAAKENPQAIHGTEHLTEANSVGASFGIGSGIHWGTAGSMRNQRYNHASPVSNALGWPRSVIWAFPHASDLHFGAPPGKYHAGLDLMERRGDIAGGNTQQFDIMRGQKLPFARWINELWLERTRNTTFAWRGLRPFFPEDWDRAVLSYFAAADGAEFRYVKKPWGTAFVERKGGQESLVYGRIHGAREAALGAAGNVANWPLYNADGPAGLHPGRYYVANPAATRPAVYFRTNNQFAPGLYEGYVYDGYVGAHSAWLDLRSLEQMRNITRYDSVVLVSPRPPKRVWVNGEPVAATPVAGQEGQWQINVALPAKVAVLFADAPATLAESIQQAYARCVGSGDEQRSDYVQPEFAATFLAATPDGWKLDVPPLLPMRTQTFVPLRAPEGQAGAYQVTVSSLAAPPDTLGRVLLNGDDLRVGVRRVANQDVAEFAVPLSAATPDAVLGIEGAHTVEIKLRWTPAGDGGK
jgi:hypothetical protein